MESSSEVSHMHNIVYGLGENEWPKWAKWPLKIAALIQEFRAKKVKDTHPHHA